MTDLLSSEAFGKLPEQTQEEPSVPSLSPEAFSKLPAQKEEKPVEEFEGISANDLTRPEIYDQVVMPYLKDRYKGFKEIEEWDANREEGVNVFLNNVRGVSSGNLYRAGAELRWLSRQDDESKARAGAAYSLYENMENIFTGEMTFGERAEGFGDFTRTMVLDPTNVLAFIGGKVWATGGTKAASRLAQKTAMQMYKKKKTQMLAKGATQEIAEKGADEAAEKLFNRSIRESNRVVSQKAAKRAAELEAAKNSFQRATRSTAMKEILGSTAIGTVSALAADGMQQRAWIDTDVQEMYNPYQAGIVALGGLVAGGISFGAAMMSPSKAPATLDVAQPTPKDVNQAAQKVLKDMFKEGTPWKQKVRSGKELSDLDTDFFTTFVYGDERLGLKGLAEEMLEQGLVYTKRGKEDKFANYLADTLRKFDPTDAKDFIKTFEDAAGVKLPEATKSADFIEQFSNDFARKMSDAGRTLGALGRTARLHKKALKDTTLENYWRSEFGFEPKEAELGRLGKALDKNVGEFLEKKFGVGTQGIRNFQNNIIKNIVAMAGTTMLNIKGWSMMTTFNSFEDMVSMGVHANVGAFKKVFGGDGTRNFQLAGHLYRNQLEKVKAGLNPNITVDSVADYAVKRKDFVRELYGVVKGEVDAGEIIKKEGFDPNKTAAGIGFDAYTDFNLGISLARGADVYTNAIEFYSQMDKKLRIEYGKGWSEFMDTKGVNKIMATDTFRKIEAAALYETRTSVMSQSYKGKDAVGEVAGVFEDFRNIPGIGILMPFGRFFNNQIATAISFTPVIPNLAKAFGFFKYRSHSQIAARSLSAGGLAALFYGVGKESQERDLALFEVYDPVVGDVKDTTFEYPLASFVGLGRLMAMKKEYGEVPKDAASEYLKTMGGQITREISTASEGLGNVITNFLQGKTEGFDILYDAVEKVGETAISGVTRTYEPANIIFGLLKGAENDYADKRQGSEFLNKSLRYIDQFAQVAKGGPLAPQKFSASQGRQVPSVSKFIGFREGQELTSFQQLLNSVGTNEYRSLSNYTMSPEADNRYNQLFNVLAEREAKKLLQSKKWNEETTEGNLLEQRKTFLSELIKNTSDSVYRVMETDLVEHGDIRLVKMFKLSKAQSRTKIEKAMEDLFPEGDLKFEELGEEQIDQLEVYFKHRDSYIRGGKIKL